MKTRSQLAVATQRAASLFALQEKLIETFINDVQTHLQVTKDANKTLEYDTVFFEYEFVRALVKQLEGSAGPAEDGTGPVQGAVMESILATSTQYCDAHDVRARLHEMLGRSISCAHVASIKAT